MRRHRIPLLVALAAAIAAAIPTMPTAAGEVFPDVSTAQTTAGGGFPDVAAGYWAEDAIDYVAWDRVWMRDFGLDEFRPEAKLRRRHLARAVVRAFGGAEEPDPSITFSDLPADDPFYEFANIAVKKGWMLANGGEFRPLDRARKHELDRALVKALGLGPEVAGLNGIRTAGGYQFPLPKGFAFLVLAQELGLHHNHGTAAEHRELPPSSKVRRADAAYALWKADLAQGTYKITALAKYRDVEVGSMGKAKRNAAEFALAYAGYPYVWAGEWHAKTPPGYCCGAQAKGGFDCSGFAWWVLKEPAGGWDNTDIRPYDGWPLPERSSKDMAKAAPSHLTYGQSRSLDIMFFDSEGGSGWAGVDHAAIYLGKGWAIDSSNSRDGVSVVWVKEGWYRDHFVWSRRVIG